ncbi:MAG: phage capsid protein [Clostridiales bacterium]|nr:phage capsid protein [Candidatus Cacconaster stercorequi]
MPNSNNYAEVWEKDLLEVLIQGCLTSPFITTNVRFLDAKTFHFTQMSVSGYKDHSRAGGWNKGVYTQTDKPFTLTHDRDVEFLVDKADVDETNATASIQNISMVFEKTQSTPEVDALFFSRVAAAAQGVANYHSSTAVASYTTSNVFGKLKTYLKAGKLRRYKADGSLVMYVTSDIMDLLEQSKDFTRQIEMTQVAEGGIGIETRVTEIDGVPVMEVIDDERFYDAFNWNPDDGGFEPLEAVYEQTEDEDIVEGKTYYTKSGTTYTAVANPVKTDIADYYEKTTVGAHKINVLIASLNTVKSVPKISSIYYFAPGTHTEGDGWLYQNRQLSDTFVFPNGKDGNIDSVYVDVDTAEIGA